MIAIVGSSNMDIVLTVEHFTKPGETQKVLKVEYFPGGKGANQAVAVARLSNNPVYFLTAVGNDSYGKKLIEGYERQNITGYRVADEALTGMAFIEVTVNGENRIMITPGANAHLSKDMILEASNELLKQDILLVQNEIPFESTLTACQLFKEVGKTVIFDPAPAQGIDAHILKYVDYLTPNEEELKTISEQLFGSFISIENSYQKMKDCGLKALIVKQGEKGATYIDSQTVYHVPTIKVTPTDTTAAGDVFNGALAVALNENKNILEAIKFANLCAAISVTRKGAQPSIPNRIEVNNFVKST
ncbi:ribokinase [Fervidobacterium sp.]